MHFRVLDNGKLPSGIRETLAKLIPTYAGKHMKLTLTEAGNTASDRQRRYYFGVIVKSFVEHFSGKGETYTKEQMHNCMMRSIGGFSNPFVNPFTGEPDEGRKSYNELTKAQAEGYHVLCLKWGAENGFQIPMPDEADYDNIR